MTTTFIRSNNLRLFILVILSAVIPAAVVGMMTIQVSQSSLLKEAQIKLSVANSTTGAQLIDWINGNKQALTYLAAVSSLPQNPIQAYMNNNTPIVQAQKLTIRDNFKKFTAIHTSFTEIFLLHPQTGKVLISTIEGHEGKLNLDQKYFMEGKKQTFTQNVYYSLSLQRMAITISSPVSDDKDNLIGVLVGHINLDQLNSVLKKPKGLGKSVKSYAVNSFRLIVAGLPEKTAVKENYSYNQLNILPVIEGFKGKTGTSTYISYDGKTVLGSYQPIPQLELLTVTEMDEEEILQPINTIRKISQTASLVSLGATVIIATYLMRLFLSATETYRKKLEITNSKLSDLSISLETDKMNIENLLRSLNEGVLAVDSSDIVWLCNSSAEKTLGKTRTMLVKQKIDDVFKVYSGNHLLNFSEYSQLKNTIVRWYSQSDSNQAVISKTLALAIAPIQIDILGQNGWVITFNDITKEEQLEAMKLDFVAMSAHELRTPLTVVKGYLSVLVDDKTTMEKLSEDEKQSLSRAFLSATRLSKLIENLLIVARIEKGKIPLDLKSAAIEELITQTVNDLSGVAEMKKIYLNFHKPDYPLPPVLMDKFRIEEVLNNLIGNAVNYSNKGGVTIDAYIKEQSMVVSVKDTGEGIPKEAIEHLFTKFFRVKSPLEAGSKGNGLGLYIAKNIIDAHNGTIWVESTEGVGSTFYFSLPMNINT